MKSTSLVVYGTPANHEAITRPGDVSVHNGAWLEGINSHINLQQHGPAVLIQRERIGGDSFCLISKLHHVKSIDGYRQGSFLAAGIYLKNSYIKGHAANEILTSLLSCLCQLVIHEGTAQRRISEVSEALWSSVTKALELGLKKSVVEMDATALDIYSEDRGLCIVGYHEAHGLDSLQSAIDLAQLGPRIFNKYCRAIFVRGSAFNIDNDAVETNIRSEMFDLFNRNGDLISSLRDQERKTEEAGLAYASLVRANKLLYLQTAHQREYSQKARHFANELVSISNSINESLRLALQSPNETSLVDQRSESTGDGVTHSDK